MYNLLLIPSIPYLLLHFLYFCLYLHTLLTVASFCICNILLSLNAVDFLLQSLSSLLGVY